LIGSVEPGEHAALLQEIGKRYVVKPLPGIRAVPGIGDAAFTYRVVVLPIVE